VQDATLFRGSGCMRREAAVGIMVRSGATQSGVEFRELERVARLAEHVRRLLLWRR
jgi:hypothetical protein